MGFDATTEMGQVEIRIISSLKQQINIDVPKSINSRREYDRYLLLSRTLDTLGASKELYDASCLKLPFWKLESLNSEQLKELKEHLKKTVLNNNKADLMYLDNIHAVLDPESEFNIIEHELDHLKVLPEGIRNKSTVDISFVWYEGKFFIVGGANYDRASVDSFKKAVSATEPKNLSEDDIEIARRYAKETGNLEFIKQIEDRISSRKKQILS